MKTPQASWPKGTSFKLAVPGIVPQSTYKIVRHFAPHLDKENEVIDSGLSLEEVQEHCQDPDTREEGQWFDGYTEE